MASGRKKASTRRKKRGVEEIDVARFVRRAVITDETKRFRPTKPFAEYSLHPQIKKNIAKRGFLQPTPIQDATIPAIASGRDVVGVAETGTGKTAAFLLPLIDTMARKQASIRVLILAPTRELAIQLRDEFHSFSDGLNLSVATLSGGVRSDRQSRALTTDPECVIGTPGRIADMIERQLLDVGKFSVIVIDEMDRLLDMGFAGTVRGILGALPVKRQILLFSATTSPDVRALAKKFQKDPVTAFVKARATAERVAQDVVRFDSEEDKIEQLHDLLLGENFHRTIVFVATRQNAESLATELADRGFTTRAIHGETAQGRRNRALADFRSGIVAVLVATDVAARGLDIQEVSDVVNYDVPDTYEDYIHRVGRTGRAGREGRAHTFLPREAAKRKFAKGRQNR